MLTRIALTRHPSRRLAEGLVTHLARTPIDLALADRQHQAYQDALAGRGWQVHQVGIAEDCPDSVFIEDTVVVFDDLAVLTRPGAPSRRPEVSGVDTAVREIGLTIERIAEPGTLDGGDVLPIGPRVYVGRSGRTNAEGIRQLRALLAPRGRTVVAVALGAVLHLKSAATALPDGTVLALPDLVDTAVFASVRLVAEEAGAHVVPLDGDAILIAASAPRTAEMLDDLGFTPVIVDISEFERLEGCVTCLSVLIGRAG